MWLSGQAVGLVCTRPCVPLQTPQKENLEVIDPKMTSAYACTAELLTAHDVTSRCGHFKSFHPQLGEDKNKAQSETDFPWTVQKFIISLGE